jgi:hypothetical protein
MLGCQSRRNWWLRFCSNAWKLVTMHPYHTGVILTMLLRQVVMCDGGDGGVFFL